MLCSQLGARHPLLIGWWPLCCLRFSFPFDPSSPCTTTTNITRLPLFPRVPASFSNTSYIYVQKIQVTYLLQNQTLDALPD